MWKRIILGILVTGLFTVGVMTYWVQREAPFARDVIAQSGKGRALVLFHPSRDQGFSDDLTTAVARGLHDAGLKVERQTMTQRTPAELRHYQLIAVVSTTFFGQPDSPSMRYLARAEFHRIPTIGIIAGAGSADVAQGKLWDALINAGGDVRGVRALWISRPNDPKRLQEPNRTVAADKARDFARDTGWQVQVERSRHAGLPWTGV